MDAETIFFIYFVKIKREIEATFKKEAGMDTKHIFVLDRIKLEFY